MYVFEHDGRRFAGTPDEYREFCLQLIARLRTESVSPLKNKAQLLLDNYYSLMLLNEQHRVVSFFCELFGGASINENFLDPAFNALEGCDAALAGTDVQAAAQSISAAEAHVNAAVEMLSEYQRTCSRAARRRSR